MPHRLRRSVPRKPPVTRTDAPPKPYCVRVDFRMNLPLMAALFVALARRYPAVLTVELHHRLPGDRMRTYLETHGVDGLVDIVADWEQVPEVQRQWAQRQVQAYADNLRLAAPTAYSRLMATDVLRVPR